MARLLIVCVCLSDFISKDVLFWNWDPLWSEITPCNQVCFLIRIPVLPFQVFPSVEKSNLRNPIFFSFFFKAAGGVFLPSRGSVINNSSMSPDGINPDLVKPVLVAAIILLDPPSKWRQRNFFPLMLLYGCV